MKTHNHKNINTNSSSFVGYIDIDYKTLVEKLGQPHNHEGYKTDAEWDIQFDDGTIATVYNWKDGHNYNNGKGLNVEDIRDWHIGGFNKKAVELVHLTVNQHFQHKLLK